MHASKTLTIYGLILDVCSHWSDAISVQLSLAIDLKDLKTQAMSYEDFHC